MSRPLRQALFEFVRAYGSTTRAEMGRRLGVSAASVSAVTSDLITEGFLRETADPDTPDTDPPRSARGRPPVSLQVAAEAHHVIGVKLGDLRHTAVLSDFAGQRIADLSLPTRPHRKSAAILIAEARALIDQLLAQQGMSRAQIRCVGLGMAGMVDYATGNVPWSPMLDAPGLGLRAQFEAALGVPAYLDNDANLLTLAELWFGGGRGKSDFAVVTIEHGVGMGLVLFNQLYRGARGMGMELGHTKVQLDGALCRCGKRGCLEAYVADYALAREAATALDQHASFSDSPLALLEDLFAEARRGNEAALSIFRRAGRYLALGLSNVAQMFDPEVIILAGGRMQYDYLYAREVLAEMQAMTLTGARAPARVEIHAWGDLVWAQGAVALALGQLTDDLLGAQRQGAA
ncbi:MAG: ROK family protein [Rhodobacteraceae bacterium]|nr:MAG: ROK family protein [Paracoccaceae bacterium]